MVCELLSIKGMLTWLAAAYTVYVVGKYRTLLPVPKPLAPPTGPNTLSFLSHLLPTHGDDRKVDFLCVVVVGIDDGDERVPAPVDERAADDQAAANQGCQDWKGGGRSTESGV